MPRTANPNRTDLNGPPKPAIESPGRPNGLPVTVPTGLPYGEAGELAAAQRQAPLPGAGGSSAPVAAPVGQPAPAGAAGFDFAPAVEAARGWTPPTLNLGGPTERPGEPLTAGLPVGAGPGPAQPFGGGPNPLAQAAAILNSIGGGAGPETAQLRAKVNVALANQGTP